MVAPPQRSPLAWLLVPLVLGYACAPPFPAQPLLLTALGLLLACVAFGAASTGGRWAGRAWPVLAFAAAALLAGGYLQHRMSPPPGWESLPPREAELTLKIERLFGSGTERIHGFAAITEADFHLSDLIGHKVYFSLLRGEEEEERWVRGTRLRTVGVLEKIFPEAAEESSFLSFLVQSGAHFQYRRVLLREAPIPSSGFFAFCARQHDRFEHYLRRGSTEKTDPVVNIFVAMLLGKRTELSDEQRRAFLHSGTLHLFAISGLHIGVIAFALHSLLTLLRIPPKPAALIGLSLLLCFVGITGAAPSAVRAFLMIFFFWGAHFVKRSPNPVAALANSAILVLLLYPQQLWSPGFQLSYSVVAGILFLGLPLGRHLQEKWAPFCGLPPDSLNRLQRAWSNLVRQTTMMLGVSLSATLLSSPLSIHYFGLFTPGAILLNLVMIPAAGLVIVAGFTSVVLNLIGLGILGVVFNHAAWLVLSAMKATVTFSGSIPALFWQASFHHQWQGSLVLFTLLGSLLICAHRRWEAPVFHFVAPFLVFVIWLLVAAKLTFPAD